MEDVDDSSSEANISVTGIIDLERSPHTYNKTFLGFFFFLR